MTIQSKLETLVSEQVELKRTFQQKATELFKEVTKEFFDKNPGVTAIKWTQYTPYFADGDPCVFGVNEPTFTNAPLEELEEVSPWGEYEGEDESIWAAEAYTLNSTNNYYKEQQEQIAQSGGVDIESCSFISKTICSSEMEDVMYDMFGDHVVVTATREGFEVDEYDHD